VYKQKRPIIYKHTRPMYSKRDILYTYTSKRDLYIAKETLLMSFSSSTYLSSGKRHLLYTSKRDLYIAKETLLMSFSSSTYLSTRTRLLREIWCCVVSSSLSLHTTSLYNIQ